MKKIKARKTAVSGMFYEREKPALEAQLDNFLTIDYSSEVDDSNIVGAVVPHAGYLYSGNVAAYAYKAIQKAKPQLVVVFGPSHNKYFKGIAISDNEAFKTPLGNVDVNLPVAQKLVINPLIQLTDKLDINEHSIEVQIPFIKKVCPSAKIIPALVGEISLEELDSIAATFVDVLSSYSKVVFVASSDLSHFHEYEKATSMDKALIELLEENSIDKIITSISSKEIEACGIVPILLVQKILSLGGNIAYENLHYENSGDVLPENRDRVVGYTAGIFFRK